MGGPTSLGGGLGACFPRKCFYVYALKSVLVDSETSIIKIILYGPILLEQTRELQLTTS